MSAGVAQQGTAAGLINQLASQSLVGSNPTPGTSTLTKVDA